MKVPVHTNGPLTVLPQLIQQPSHWGKHCFPNIGGTCLVLQVIYAIEAQTGINADVLVDRLNKQDVHAGTTGVTLATLSRAFNPILGGKRLGAARLPCVQTAVQALKAGSTVLAIGGGLDNMMYEFAVGKRGIVRRKYIKEAAGPEGRTGLHSLLLVGVDEQQKTIVLRESRPTYHHEWNGMVKYPLVPLINNGKAFAYIDLVVH